MYSSTLVGMVSMNISYCLNKSIVKKVLYRPFPLRLFIQKLNLLWKIIKAENKRKQNEKKHSIKIPPVCIVSVTNHCNLQCMGCEAINHSGTDELSRADLEKAISEAIELGIYLFVIAGGEPLFVKDLIEILRAYPQAIFLVFTNGLLLNQNHISTFKKSRHLIPILSFEGNEYYNDARRGKGNGAKIKLSLQLLQQNKLIYGFSTMAVPQNLDYIISKE